jgi:hypothetical protein
MLQKIKIFILILIAGIMSAESVSAGTGDWKIYRAYQDASIVAETSHHVFAVFAGSLLSYNPDDGEIRTFSTLNGLHDTNIQFMAWCSEASALVLVYSNGNIDIMGSENDIANISAIKDNTTIRDKAVYNLEIEGSTAYISTAFGIVAVDVPNRVIAGTYRFDVRTLSVCFHDGYIYASTDDGVKKALLTANLLDRENWHLAEDVLWAEWIVGADKIMFFDDNFIFLGHGDLMRCGYREAPVLMLSDIKRTKLVDNRIVALSADSVHFFSSLTNHSALDLKTADIDCINKNSIFWTAPVGRGLSGFKLSASGNIQEEIATDIKVNSPKRNSDFFMTHTAGKLLIAGGGRTYNRLAEPGTLMVYENGQWTNFDEEKIAEQTGLICADFMSVAVDPLDADHYFVGSWGEGLYEFKNNEFVNLYSHGNSALQTAVPTSADNFVRVDGLVFDRNNTLFMVNGDVPNGMVSMSADGKWESYYYEPLANNFPNAIVIDSYNRKWLNIWRQTNAGILVLDENNEQIAYSNHFTDNLNTDVQASYYLCIAEDLHGDIWVGTDNGPIIFGSPDDVQNGRCYRRTVRDQYGSAKYMLDKERITAIAVDGGNRKWVGTQNSGLFVIDESVGDIPKVDNFNTTNSYLLSDYVVSLAIDHATGELFVGTDKGLCSYMTGATSGAADYSEVYAFPNPVTTASDWTTITGLVENSTVKITDMAGNIVVESRSMGGQFTWDLKNRSGRRVKAGIYLVFAATSDGSQGVVTKVMVIR